MSFKDEVIELLKKEAAELFGVSPDTLGAGTRFKADLNCKSADIVRFTVALENEYDVEVPYMAFSRCATFDEAGDFISKLVGIE